MSIRRLSAWALIFSGLLAYVLAFEKPALKPQKQSPRGDYEKAFDFPQSDISSLTVSRPGKSVTIAGKNLKWVVTDPPGAEAQSEQCQSMVSAVTDTVVLSVIEENPADVKQYGLDAPELVIAVQADGGRYSTFKLGKKSPSEVSQYALDVERRRVVLVGTYVSFSAKMFIDNVKGLPAK